MLGSHALQAPSLYVQLGLLQAPSLYVQLGLLQYGSESAHESMDVTRRLGRLIYSLMKKLFVAIPQQAQQINALNSDPTCIAAQRLLMPPTSSFREVT